MKVRKCDWPECQTPLDKGVTRYKIATEDRAAITVDLCPVHEKEAVVDVLRGRSRKKPTTASARVREAKARHGLLNE